VRGWIEQAASDKCGTMESRHLERIRAHLKRDLGLEIGEVEELVKRWPAGSQAQCPSTQIPSSSGDRIGSALDRLAQRRRPPQRGSPHGLR